MKTAKTPILVVTSENWSRDSYVVFDDDVIIGWCIPDEWVLRSLQAAQDEDDIITREAVESGMEDDFFADNTDVDEYWPEHNILKAGDYYYKYSDDGMCTIIDDDDALAIIKAK